VSVLRALWGVSQAVLPKEPFESTTHLSLGVPNLLERTGKLVPTYRCTTQCEHSSLANM